MKGNNCHFSTRWWDALNKIETAKGMLVVERELQNAVRFTIHWIATSDACDSRSAFVTDELAEGKMLSMKENGGKNVYNGR